MPSNISPEIRALPLYRDGLDAGRDIGLVIALSAICGELARQDAATVIATATDPNSPAASRHEYAAGRLLDVGQIVAGRFRQATR
jgi:hypothetical protein